MIEPALIPENMRTFGLTFVVYHEGDIIGKILALLSLLPIFLIVAVFTSFVTRRDLAALSLLVGQFFNQIVSVSLKKIFKQPRPAGAPALRSDYGMPSSHSQFMAFFSVFFIMVLSHRTMRHWPRPARLIANATIALLSLLVAYSRIYQEYHSISQVLVGLLIGSTLGFAWSFLELQFFIPRIYPSMEGGVAGRWLALKDSYIVEDVHKFEFENLQSHRKKTDQKKL